MKTSIFKKGLFPAGPVILVVSKLALLLAWFVSIEGAKAQINPVPLTFADQFQFSFVADWLFGDDEESATLGFTRGLAPTAWAARVGSTETVDGKKDLALSVDHLSAPHGEPANRNLNLALLNNERPAAGQLRRATAEQFTHALDPADPKATDHLDIIRFSAELPSVGNGTIRATGQHVRPRDRLTTGSLQVALGFSGSARFKSGGITEDIDNLRPGDHIRRPLAPGATSYEVVAALNGASLPNGDPVTDTTLAFLGKVDGVPGELDLGAAMELFEGDDEFKVPLLTDTATGQNLFVAADLTQWLSFPEAFSDGDHFAFSSGLNDNLLGITVGTSPITFDPLTATWNNPAPFAGELEVSGFIDGGSSPVPESASTLVLLVVGLCGMGGARVGKRAR